MPMNQFPLAATMCPAFIRFFAACCAVSLFLLWPFTVNAHDESTDNCVTTAYGPVPEYTDRVVCRERAPDVFVRIHYPEFGIAWLDKNILEEVRTFTLNERPEDMWRTATKRGKGKPEALERSFGCTLTSPKAGFVSIVYNSWRNDRQMIHGYWEAWAQSFDLQNNRQLELQDIFRHWAADQTAFRAVVRKAFLVEHGNPALESSLEQTLEAYEEVMPGDIPGEFNSFLLSPEGLVLVMAGLPRHLWDYSMTTIPWSLLKSAGLEVYVVDNCELAGNSALSRPAFLPRQSRNQAK